MLYIDTERKFSAGRLVEIAAARAGSPDPNPAGAAPHTGDPAALAVRVLVASPASALELLSMLQARRRRCIGAAGAVFLRAHPPSGSCRNAKRTSSDAASWGCQGLEAAVIERGVRLVVVDSIAALARADYAAAQLPERQQALGAPKDTPLYLAVHLTGIPPACVEADSYL